jgi:ArsR family transcriptional regulator, arsenate/arsenite/antimonite-responsive transcriptional repressor
MRTCASAEAMVLRGPPDYPEEMADIFDVLADGTRRELLQRLLESSHLGLAPNGEISVGDLVNELGISQPTVSKHLKVLRDHGLVTVREEGQHRYYHLDPGPLNEVSDWLSPFVDAEFHTPPPGGATVFAAWAGTEVGDKVGRAAAETAHTARVAIEAAQEKIQGAQKRVADKLPFKREG